VKEYCWKLDSIEDSSHIEETKKMRSACGTNKACRVSTDPSLSECPLHARYFMRNYKVF
jgi:hypothetical protein